MRAGIFTLVVAAACSSVTCPPVEATVGGQAFRLELADDAAERARGLMNRDTLADDAGMLFVFDDADTRKRRFHMQNTLIPLDLIAIANGKIVSIDSMVPCEQTPCLTTVTAPAQEVIEVNGGLARRLGLRVGDETLISRPLGPCR